MLDVHQTRADFPILAQKYEGKDLVYLDSSATSQKPWDVINTISDFYQHHNANVSRSAHFLAEKSDEMYEGAREKVADFINGQPPEVIFTKNASEGLNLVALSWGGANLKKGDIVLTNATEHNSSILPWKVLCERVGASIEYIDVTEEGYLVQGWEKSFTESVKVVAVSHASNVLGSIMPIKDICRAAKAVGVISVIDGSQAVSHLTVDVQDLGCDFYSFSGHKMFGPTGIGVLWGKKSHLDKMPPLMYGGGMVESISDGIDLRETPYKFETGTPNIAGAVALGAAIDYINVIGVDFIRKHDVELTSHTINKLKTISGLSILGPQGSESRVGLVSFAIENVHSHDIAAILSSEGVAVRAGLHCAMHLHKDMELPASTRASFHAYNTLEEVDKLVAGVEKAVGILT